MFPSVARWQIIVGVNSELIKLRVVFGNVNISDSGRQVDDWEREGHFPCFLRRGYIDMYT